MVLLLLVMANLTAVAAPLEVVRHEQLVTALSYQTEIANNLEKSQAPYMVRVYEVPTVIEECWGKIESCPDHLLYITASERDLNATPRLYRLPKAEGWKFVTWSGDCPPVDGQEIVGMVLQTALPDDNIDAEKRATWVAKEYTVCVSPNGATAKVKQHNKPLNPTGAKGAPAG